MGSYQEGVAKNEVNKLPVTAHIYEYTTQVSIFSSFLKISGPENPLHGSPDPAALLPQREEPKEDQLAPLATQCLWVPPPTERLRPLEGVRHQL
ncbi:hypothetical protein H0H92_007612 [Tricholoma furcatifolium]|nr:hypothetical protein H0H92_007612 [Tricholoma furcatifolium]